MFYDVGGFFTIMYMVSIEEFTRRFVTEREESLFLPDIEANREELSREIKGKRTLVIGGAGSIGSSFIRALLRFEPEALVVVDLNENGLAELTRDLRSTEGLAVPETYLTYTLDFADPMFERIFREHGPFDIVANFSAHKHVRSEKDRFSVEALLRNNVIKARGLLDMLAANPPKHFFCVSTDKAANPVNVMGASKSLMERLIMAYSEDFKVTTARFANVAFSNGSLPLSFFDRMMKRQPLVAPRDVKRYFVSLEESGQICLLACIFGKTGEIFFPKLDEEQMKTFSSICDKFIREQGREPLECASDAEARSVAARLAPDDPRCPVYYFDSDTTGEKGYEEFYVEGEAKDMSRFESLGVISKGMTNTREEVADMLARLERIFAEPDFTKADVVGCLKELLPDFQHEEKGKNLDQKM